jgi:alpha,alpha-trehalose phosphorylase
VAGFGGMRDHEGHLSFAPRLPERLARLAFGLCFRGRRLRVEVDHAQVRYLLLEGDPLDITHHGERMTVSTEEEAVRPVPQLPPAGDPPRQPPGREPPRRRPPTT